MKKKKSSTKVVEKVIEKTIKTNSMKVDSFYFWDGDVLVFNILGTPSAKQDAIGKVKGNQLKISVTEAPKRGKATDHMVRFLAKIFEVPVSDIEVVFGRMSIHKQVRIKSPKKLPPVFIEPDAS
ncbi:MAG: DUF167 family protein [Bacteriovorax sp.]|nr:DUF167 family protein [Bacteriovorax sp.]